MFQDVQPLLRRSSSRQNQTVNTRSSSRRRRPRDSTTPSKPYTRTWEIAAQVDQGPTDIPLVCIENAEKPDNDEKPALASAAEVALGGVSDKPQKKAAVPREKRCEVQCDEPYQCCSCDASFTMFSLLKIHMEEEKRKNNNKKLVRCGYCQRTCLGPGTLRAHMISHPIRKCHYCSLRFVNPTALQAHRVCHDKKKPYRCMRCKESFITTKDLKQHRTAAERCTPCESWTCANCEERMPTLFALAKHNRVYHKGAHKCDVCGKAFASKGFLESHKRNHEIDNTMATTDAAGNTVQGVKPRKQHMCHFCSKLFGQRQSLKNHIRSHTGERPYQCDKCPKAFSCRTYLARHLKSHQGERNYKCDKCPAAFIHQNQLGKHHKSVHSDVRPYACGQCDASFKLTQHLKRHMLQHTGEKPYLCDLCPATFIQRGNLKIHMKVHNRDRFKDKAH